MFSSSPFITVAYSCLPCALVRHQRDCGIKEMLQPCLLCLRTISLVRHQRYAIHHGGLQLPAARP